MSKEGKMTRREFLEAVPVVTAGTILASCGMEVKQNNTEVKFDPIELTKTQKEQISKILAEIESQSQSKSKTQEVNWTVGDNESCRAYLEKNADTSSYNLIIIMHDCNNKYEGLDPTGKIAITDMSEIFVKLIINNDREVTFFEILKNEKILKEREYQGGVASSKQLENIVYNDGNITVNVSSSKITKEEFYKLIKIWTKKILDSYESKNVKIEVLGK